MREQATPSADTDRSLEQIDASAARFDPWLFSDECETAMAEMAELSDFAGSADRADTGTSSVPSPVDVMNFSLLLGAQPRVFKDEPATAGNSKFWAVELPNDVYQFVADPTLVFAPSSVRLSLGVGRSGGPCSSAVFSPGTVEALEWDRPHAGPRFGVLTPLGERA